MVSLTGMLCNDEVRQSNIKLCCFLDSSIDVQHPQGQPSIDCKSMTAVAEIVSLVSEARQWQRSLHPRSCGGQAKDKGSRTTWYIHGAVCKHDEFS